jgi:drug/metabolite transporter (DMT)-like permease
MPKPAAPTRVAVLAALLAVYIVWGSTYLGIQFAVAAFPPFAMSSIRFVIAGALLYGWARMRGAARPTAANWRAAAIIGTLLLLGGNGLVSLAEQQGVPSGLTALLVALSPIWMTLIDWLRPHGVRPTAIVVAGLLLGFGGVALLIAPAIFGHTLHSFNPLIMLIVPLSSLCWASGSVYARSASMPASPLLANGIEMLAGGVALGIVGLATGEWTQIHPAQITLSATLALVYLILIGSLVGFTAYIWLLRHTPLAIASTYAYVNPAVAVFLGWALVGERLTPLTLVAAAIIILSVCLITLFRPAPQATPVVAPLPATLEEAAAVNG